MCNIIKIQREILIMNGFNDPSIYPNLAKRIVATLEEKGSRRVEASARGQSKRTQEGYHRKNRPQKKFG